MVLEEAVRASFVPLNYPLTTGVPIRGTRLRLEVQSRETRDGRVKQDGAGLAKDMSDAEEHRSERLEVEVLETS